MNKILIKRVVKIAEKKLSSLTTKIIQTVCVLGGGGVGGGALGFLTFLGLSCYRNNLNRSRDCSFGPCFLSHL